MDFIGEYNMLNKIKVILKLLGVNHIINLKNYIWYIQDYAKFKKLHKQGKNRFDMSFFNIYPCVYDKTSTTGFDRHYIWHEAWAARKLKEIAPEIHYDISSSLNFIAIMSAYIKIKFYDYRPANLFLSNLDSTHADLINLPFESNSIDSLSCMHVVEHIGLGRYGDQLDLDGDLKAIEEIKRVVAINGDLLFVVPIGQSKIMFNAHRVYSYEQIVNYFSLFELVEFSLIPDSGKGDKIINNASKEESGQQIYGCGLFHFKKRMI